MRQTVVRGSSYQLQCIPLRAHLCGALMLISSAQPPSASIRRAGFRDALEKCRSSSKMRDSAALLVPRGRYERQRGRPRGLHGAAERPVREVEGARYLRACTGYGQARRRESPSPRIPHGGIQFGASLCLGVKLTPSKQEAAGQTPEFLALRIGRRVCLEAHWVM